MTDSPHDLNTLVARIDAARLTGGDDDADSVGGTGRAFVCKFHDRINPHDFYETVFTTNEPWQMFATRYRIDDGSPHWGGDKYWGVNAVAAHVEDGDTVGASKLDLELWPAGLRVYVKGDAPSAGRIAEFLETVREHYPFDYTGLPAADDLPTTNSTESP